MKIRASSLVCNLLLMAAMLLSAAAQSGRKPPPQTESQNDSPISPPKTSSSLPADPALYQEPIIRIDTDLVSVDVTATDAAGNYVRDLKAGDFQVYEEGVLRKVDFFNVMSEATLSRPLAVVFALDLSGSLKPEETATLKNAALKFTEILRGDSIYAAMSFNYDVKILQDFTSDAERIAKAFSKVSRFEGSTRIYDALDRALLLFTRRPPRTRQGFPMRRVVIVITDGFDSASIIDRRELIRRANAVGATIYSITLPSYILSPTTSTERVITPLDASRIVVATGGRDFPADASDFTPVFKTLAEEIRASYGLAWYPEMRDGKYRSLKVVSTRPGITLRVNRAGYTAPKM
jgi:VWFA-related protein